MTSESNSAACPAPRFRKIDLHTHILPEHMPDWTKRFGYGDFIRLDHYCDCKAKMYKGDKFFREIEENCYRTGPRVRDLNDTGVDVQVLSTVPVMFNYQAKPEDTLDMARFLNDHIASICKAQPDRFVGLGTVPMQHAEFAIQELRRCVRELGLAGIQIGSSINEFSLCDKELFPIFEEAERLGACIFVHPWDMPGTNDPRKSKYWLPWLVEMPAATAHAICCMIFGGVLERYPKLRVCFAHGGGSFPATIGRIEHGFNVRPDLVQVDNKRNPREYLGRFWVDSLVHDPLAMKFLLDVIGKDNVCLGSDYPFPLGEHHPGLMVEQMALPEPVKERVLWLNGLSFLGLKEDRFLPPAQLPEPRPTSAEAACLHEEPPKDSEQSQAVQSAQVDQLQQQVDSLSVSRQ